MVHAGSYDTNLPMNLSNGILIPRCSRTLSVGIHQTHADRRVFSLDPPPTSKGLRKVLHVPQSDLKRGLWIRGSEVFAIWFARLNRSSLSNSASVAACRQPLGIT